MTDTLQHQPTLTAAGQKIFPVFLVVDTSYSMEGDRLAAAQALAPQLIDACLEDPSITDKVRVELIEFNSSARVLIPSARATEVRSVPTLSVAGGTDYGAAFTLLRQRIEEVCLGIRADGYQVLRPVVFFLTDGEPIDAKRSRRAAFESLTEAGFAYRPNVCMFGVGDATIEALEPYVHGRGQVILAGGDPVAALRNLIVVITRSVIASASRTPDEEGNTFRIDLGAIDDIDDLYLN